MTTSVHRLVDDMTLCQPEPDDHPLRAVLRRGPRPSRRDRAADVELATDFIATISHELGNLLAPIRLSAAQLARDAPAGDRRRSRRPIDIIERAAGKMNGLLLDLLDDSAIQNGALTLRVADSEIDAIVDDGCLTIEPQLSAKKLRLERAVEAGLPALRCDAGRIGQVVSNLLVNAVRYSPPGGCITLRVSRRSSAIEFNVADEGPGVSAAVRGSLFQRFSKSADGHCGLGLFIARSLVEAHGGKIWLESEPTQGATFSFSLPAS